MRVAMTCDPGHLVSTMSIDNRIRGHRRIRRFIAAVLFKDSWCQITSMPELILEGLNKPFWQGAFHLLNRCSFHYLLREISSLKARPGSTNPMCCILKRRDRKSTRLNSSHVAISYAVFCLKKKTT